MPTEREITDTDRLEYLMRESGLTPGDCEGQALYLVVTDEAVAVCHGTHLPAYHRDVRSEIDRLIQKERTRGK
jgi:hypothetical protein